MAYPRDPFVPSQYLDVPDPANPPPGYIELDAEELNKFGTNIRLNREGLHASKFILNADELTAYDAINDYPASSESPMVVTHASWPEDGGVVRTFRDRASIVDSDLMSYDYQLYKAKGSNNIYMRHALMSKRATWLPSTNYVSGTIIQPATENGHYYRALTGGISKSTEPSWPTTDSGEVTETDSGGANPTITWQQEGTFWSEWTKILTDSDDLTSIIGTVLPQTNPVFIGTLSGDNINTDGTFIAAPSAQTIDDAADTILANAANIFVTSTVANLTLTSTPIIADGINGQILTIHNIGANTFTLSHGDTFNIRSTRDTDLTIPTNRSATFVFSSSLGVWIQQGTAGLMPSNNPAWIGQLSGNNFSNSGNVINTPSAAQSITAATNTITIASRKKIISNTTGGSITLVSAPTIESGTNGQEVQLINTGTQNIVLQDQGTLAGSNLRLTSSTIILTPLDSIELTFFTAVGDWVQTGPLVSVV